MSMSRYANELTCCFRGERLKNPDISIGYPLVTSDGTTTLRTFGVETFTCTLDMRAFPADKSRCGLIFELFKDDVQINDIKLDGDDVQPSTEFNIYDFQV